MPLEEGVPVLLVADVISHVERDFPHSIAEEWDNVGLQVGPDCLPCRTVMTCLTVSENAVDHAADLGVDLIIAHHPLIFTPLKTISPQEPTGRIIAKLLTHHISLYVAHTNVDKARGGLNDWLAQTLSILDTKVLERQEEEGIGYGRIGRLASPISLTSLVKRVAETLSAGPVRFVGDQDKPLTTVAVCSGSGSHLWPLALAQGADVLITGDVKYHTAVEVTNTPLALIDAGHFGTEAIFIPYMAAYLDKEAKKQQWPLRVITYEGESDPLAAVWKGV